MTAKAGVFIPITSSFSATGTTRANAALRQLQGNTTAANRTIALESSKGNKALGLLTGGFAATGTSSKLMGLAVGGSLALAGSALVGFAAKSAKSYLTATGAVREFRRVAGGTAEDASAVVFALKRVSIAPEAAAKAFFQLSKRVSTGQVDLDRYGVSIKRNTDGSINMRSAVIELAGALGKMNANQRAAAVFELFGRQGATLLPILGKTKAELLDIFDLAGKDHQIFSEQDLQRSLAYKKSLAELELAWQGVEVQIGRAAIPLMKGFADVLTPVAQLIGDNADAAAFLAKVIGGPLVAALTVLTAIKLALWFKEPARLAVSFAGKLADLAASAVTGSIAMEGFGATVATTGAEIEAAGAAASAGWLAILGPIALGAGLVAAGTAALIGLGYAVGYFDDKVNEAARRAPRWARTQVAAFKAAADGPARARVEIVKYRDRIADLETQLHRTVAAQHSNFVATQRYGIQSSEVWKIQQKLNTELETARARYDQLRVQAGPWLRSLKEIGAETTKAGTTIQGLRIPPEVLASFDSKQLKTFKADLEATRATFGDLATQAILDAGITATAMKTLTKEADQADKAIESSFRSATTVVGAFGDQTTISGDQFMRKLADMRGQAQIFALELAAAAQQGVDQGLLRSIAEAGPKAEPELRGLLDAVRIYGVGAINQTRADTDAALAQIQGTINTRIAGDAIAAERWGRAVGQGISDGLLTVVRSAVDQAAAAIRSLLQLPTSSPGRGGTRRRALGGTLRAGSPYWVSEVGGELFVPSTDGYLLSHSSAVAAVRDAVATSGLAGAFGLSGGNSGHGTTFVFHQDLRGATDPTAVREAAQAGAELGARTALRQLTGLARGTSR